MPLLELIHEMRETHQDSIPVDLCKLGMAKVELCGHCSARWRITCHQQSDDPIPVTLLHCRKFCRFNQ